MLSVTKGRIVCIYDVLNIGQALTVTGVTPNAALSGASTLCEI